MYKYEAQYFYQQLVTWLEKTFCIIHKALFQGCHSYWKSWKRTSFYEKKLEKLGKGIIFSFSFPRIEGIFNFFL